MVIVNKGSKGREKERNAIAKCMRSQGCQWKIMRRYVQGGIPGAPGAPGGGIPNGGGIWPGCPVAMIYRVSTATFGFLYLFFALHFYRAESETNLGSQMEEVEVRQEEPLRD